MRSAEADCRQHRRVPAEELCVRACHESAERVTDNMEPIGIRSSEDAVDEPPERLGDLEHPTPERTVTKHLNALEPCASKVSRHEEETAVVGEETVNEHHWGSRRARCIHDRSEGGQSLRCT